MTIYHVKYINLYRDINIDMDKNYQKILELYLRRKKQIFLMIGLAILSASLIFEIFNWVIFSFINRKDEGIAERENNLINNRNNNIKTSINSDNGRILIQSVNNIEEDIRDIPNNIPVEPNTLILNENLRNKSIKIYFYALRGNKKGEEFQVSDVAGDEKFSNILKNKMPKERKQFPKQNISRYKIERTNEEINIEKTIDELGIENEDRIIAVISA